MPEAKKVLKEIFSLKLRGKKTSWSERIYQLAILLSMLIFARTIIFVDQSDLKLWQLMLVLFTGIFIAEMTYPKFNKILIRFKQRRD